MIIFSRLKNFIFKISSAVFYKLGGKKKIFAMVLCLILIGVFCVVPLGVEANEWLETTASNFFIFIFQLFISVMGEILLLMVKILIAFCSYNDFADSTAVISGWVIVRDLVNMFFVVVLLVIAIATILKIESYNYKKMLGKLVLMAVLVNFSKTISLLFIDFAQVLMMTFVNGFQAAGGGNFVTALGLTKIFDFRTNLANENMNNFGVAGAYLLGLIMILISTVVVGMMLIILVMRTIVLWILIVLSPLAFFLSIIPQAKKYADQWWSMFTEYVLVGPILAFFLWLSLVSVTSLSPTDKPRFADDTFKTQQNVGITEVGTQNNIISFIIAIGMLVGGLTMTGKMGVMGAGIGVGVLAGAKRMGMGVARGATKYAGKKVKDGGKWVGSQVYAGTGIELRPSKIKEAKEARRESFEKQREARGKAISAERVESGNGVAKIIGAAMDPRLVNKMSRWDMAKATFSKGEGGIEARRKMERGASSQYAAAMHEMRLQDPYEAYISDEGKKQNDKKRELEVKQREINDLKNQHGNKFTSLDNAQVKLTKNTKKQESISPEIEKVEKEKKDSESAIRRLDEIRSRKQEIVRSKKGMEDSEDNNISLGLPPLSRNQDYQKLTEEENELKKEEKNLSDRPDMEVHFKIVDVDEEIKKIKDKIKKVTENIANANTPGEAIPIKIGKKRLEKELQEKEQKRVVLRNQTPEVRGKELAQRSEQLAQNKQTLEVKIAGLQEDKDVQQIEVKKIEQKKLEVEIKERAEKLKTPQSDSVYRQVLKEAKGIAKEASDIEAFKRMAEAKKNGVSDAIITEALRKLSVEGVVAMKKFLKEEEKK